MKIQSIFRLCKGGGWVTGSMDLFSFKEVPAAVETENKKLESDDTQSFSMDSFGGERKQSSVAFTAKDSGNVLPTESSKDSGSATAYDLEEAAIFFRDEKADGFICFKDSEKPDDFICFKNDGIAQGNANLKENASKMTVDESTFEFSETEADSGYVADSIESVGQDCTDSSDLIVVCPPKAGSLLVDTFKFWALCKKFEHGTLVQALDGQKKPVFLLLQVGEELMAYKYLGSSLDVEVPATVGKREVRYLHPHLLRGGINPFKGVKAQNFKSNFNVENLADLSKDALRRSRDGVRTLVLPNGIKMLPPNLFNNCLVLKEVVIPESVTAISHNTFTGSCLKDIWFNGRCPLGFLENGRLPRGVQIHYREEYADSFRGNV